MTLNGLHSGKLRSERTKAPRGSISRHSAAFGRVEDSGLTTSGLNPLILSLSKEEPMTFIF